MSSISEKTSFYTKSNNHVQLNITDQGIIARLDGRNVGSVQEGKEHGYSLNSIHSVLREGKFVRHIIIPKQSDQLRVRHFFINAKLLIPRKKMKQQEDLIKRLTLKKK